MSDVTEMTVAEETATAEIPLSEKEQLDTIWVPGNAKCFPETFERAEALAKKVAWLTKAIVKNPVVPIIENILFLNGVMYASDLQITNMHYTEIKGEFLVDGKKLLSILKKLDKLDVVSFEASGPYSVYMRVNGETIFTLAGENTMDYPKIAVLETNIPVATINSDQDMENLQVATKYTSKDELRPNLMGVLITEKEMCSTNGHWLFSKSFNGMKLNEETFSHIIPARAILMLKDFKSLEIKRNEPSKRTSPSGYKSTVTHLLLKQERRAVLVRTIDEKFPDYKNVIPQHNHIKIQIDKKQLLQTLGLALEAANRTTHQIRMAFVNNTGRVKFTAEDLDFSNEFRKEVMGDIAWGNIENKSFEKILNEDGSAVLDENGQPQVEENIQIITPEPDQEFEIGFNGKFMIDIVKDTQSNVIEISMAAANKAMLINNDILVMPVMLNQYV